jgi:hypothetical protein
MFKAPVGTQEERISGEIWPKGWDDVTGFLNSRCRTYAYGIHTGADLNRNVSGGWDSDAHAPVYAIGDGVVTYAQRWPNPKYWGNIIVIDHRMVDGKPLFSRYAHVENINFDLVKVNQPIYMGDLIAQVGNGFGLFEYHLHFDISITDILRTEPNHWPAPASNPSKKLVRDHYVDPREWLRQHVQAGSIISTRNIKAREIKPGAPGVTVWYVVTHAGVEVRQAPGLAATQVALLAYGSSLVLEKDAVGLDDLVWGKIRSGPFAGHWLKIRKLDRSETYLSNNPPQP